MLDFPMEEQVTEEMANILGYNEQLAFDSNLRLLTPEPTPEPDQHRVASRDVLSPTSTGTGTVKISDYSGRDDERDKVTGPTPPACAQPPLTARTNNRQQHHRQPIRPRQPAEWPRHCRGPGTQQRQNRRLHNSSGTRTPTNPRCDCPSGTTTPENSHEVTDGVPHISSELSDGKFAHDFAPPNLTGRLESDANYHCESPDGYGDALTKKRPTSPALSEED
ncbi:uncharacterized protein B0I36DRAFT_398941 [Microdochium trichocladiopsis]|uniref:Uncharacterized protein n=1 Tax=Microdochium trichocladiopsis TaxID=1682393 RepID=A0A9P8XU67_9PEZI|nr:uncharacterized protein B0I36DRAFT_398941 [Microdochium trichocladiopsis]KAH7012515.1 hypothetical protein B0I36DRAFT_398941 [Microdochium trichocladiopsis]